jgi:hypothetical protein
VDLSIILIGSSVVTALATVLLVVVAWRQISALRMGHELERRPYVFVEVVKETTSKGQNALYLRFTNCGKTPALNVSAKFSTDSWKNIGSRTLAFEREQGILLLPPSAKLTYFLGPADAHLVEQYSTPEGVEVEVSYSSRDPDKKHLESFVLSLLDSYGAKSEPSTSVRRPRDGR